LLHPRTPGQHATINGSIRGLKLLEATQLQHLTLAISADSKIIFFDQNKKILDWNLREIVKEFISKYSPRLGDCHQLNNFLIFLICEI
jgi:hypothetical protein